MRRLALALFALSVACHRENQADFAPDAAVSNDALSEAMRIARPDVQWSSLLGARTFERSGAAFVTQGHRDAIDGLPMAFGARVSQFADGALEVRTGDANVAIKSAGARSVEGTLVDGNVVFDRAHTSTDLVIGSAPGRVEAFFLLHDAQAPASFRLELSTTLSARVAEDGIYLADDKQIDRVRIPRPFALDAKGVRRAAAMTLEGSTIVVELDRRDLAFPILLDPALEQIAWADVGQKIPSWPPPGATTYARVTPPAGLQRVSGRMAAGNGVVYLFGGTTIVGNYMGTQTPYTTALFEWNGTAWTASAGGDFADLLILGDPTHGTVDRLSDIAWDPARKKLVMFGGATFGPLSPKLGVYEYDPSAKSWGKVCADGPPCQDTMPDINGPPSAVYAFGKTILVHASGTYQWNATSRVLEKFPATPDLKRAGSALAFDIARNRLVAYGDNSGASDTWETDGTTWTKVSATGPLAVKNTSLTYDSTRKRVYLWAANQSTGGTYSWNGATWTAVTVDGAGPVARANAAFAYDPPRGKFVLFGGGDLGGSAPADNCYDNPYSTPFDNNRDFRTCAKVDTWTSQLFGGACATTADCELGTTCVDGLCCKTACSGSCRRCDAPGSVGTCTVVSGTTDPDTCTGDFSCDATGSCKKIIGKSCSIGTDCASGNCADGYCCDTSCPGSCESCNQAGKLGTCTPFAKGSAGKSCGSFTCSGTSGACSTTCATDLDCATNAYCNASGACVPQLARGGACDRNRVCSTGVCADGVCCNSACSGTCDVCSKALGATADGTCTFLPKSATPPACGASTCSGTSASCGTSCAVDGDCSSLGYCSGGNCATKRKKGESCDRASQCDTGLACADGVCCNEACDGACRACSALNKESGDKSGECGPAKEHTNPGAKCTKSAVSGCGSSGLCDAAGSCALYAAGTPCGPSGTTSCDMGIVKGQTCDGLGACILSSIGTPCTPGLCVEGACKDTCTSDTDCADGAYCTAGFCKKKGAPGDKCGVDGQCGSGFCADGVCCSARCDGACEACDQAGTIGTCTAVTGKPRLGHPACAAGEPGNPCSAAACDGIERSKCAKKAGAEVTCRAGSCESGVESLPTTCDGSGTCPAADTRPCQPFACGADACKTACTTEADCKTGFVCNTATGTCTAGDKCAGSIVTHVDGTITDCAPYTCESSGKCKSACASSGDCVAPKVCSDAVCVDPPTAESDGSGGCVASPRGVRSTGSLLVLAALAAAFRRRRT